MFGVMVRLCVQLKCEVAALGRYVVVLSAAAEIRKLLHTILTLVS